MTSFESASANVSNGVATTTYHVNGDADVGDYNLVATYQQNNTYRESSDTADFKTRIGTVITVENTIANYNEDSTFVAHVKYNSTIAVTEGQVEFRLGGYNGDIIGTANVDNSGTATLTYVVTETYNTGDSIYATYKGTSTYGASNTSTTGTLRIRNPLAVNVANVSANRGDTATISATFTAIESGETVNINQGSAKLYINNVEQSTESVSSGAASFSYSVPNDANYGVNTIKVVYQQNDDYKSTEATATLYVRSPVTLSPTAVSGNPDETITVQVNVLDYNNTAVTEGQATITIDGTPTNVTVVNGVASMSYTVPSNATGTISFSASYTQNSHFMAGTMSTNGTITIRKVVTVTVSDVTVNVGETATLIATVKDGNDNVNIGNVTFEITPKNSGS